MNYIKHSAITFCKNNYLERKEITYKRLINSARQNGYIVKTYSASDELLIYYDLYDRAQKSSSVSITDENENILIFIDDSLTKNKQRFALAHEIGHIVLEHKPNEKTKRKQEREADLFAHYMLTGTAPPRFDFYISIISLFICITVIILSISLTLTRVRVSSGHLCKAEAPTEAEAETVDFAKQKTEEEKTTVSAPTENKDTIPADKVTIVPPSSSPSSAAESSEPQSDICYYTEHGTVYHIYRDCSYLKKSQNVYTSKIEECPLDRLCSRCSNR